MSADEHTPTITIQGLVVAREWDNDGRAIRAVIAAPGEEEYEVEPADAGLELLAHLRREVIACGDLRTSLDGRRTLLLSSLSEVAESSPTESRELPQTGA